MFIMTSQLLTFRRLCLVYATISSVSLFRSHQPTIYVSLQVVRGLLMGCGDVSVTWPCEAVQTIHLKGLFGACSPLLRLLSFATSCVDF